MVNRPDSKKARQKRHTRVRAKISGTAECPRLNVFRSLQHIYAQIIDDVSGKTLFQPLLLRRILRITAEINPQPARWASHWQREQPKRE